MHEWRLLLQHLFLLPLCQEVCDPELRWSVYHCTLLPYRTSMDREVVSYSVVCEIEMLDMFTFDRDAGCSLVVE